MSEPREGDFIQTYTGRKFWPLDPRSEEIDIADIAHALALQCRFTGHCREHYSVAQHSVLVSEVCAPPDALWGLIHDASEAFLADVARPVKQHAALWFYGVAEKRVMRAVCERFSLPFEQPPSVGAADVMLLVTEARDLFDRLVPGWKHTPENGYRALPEKIVPVSWRAAEQLFLNRFQELVRDQIPV